MSNTSQNDISTSAEAIENDILPKLAEVHADPDANGTDPDALPAQMRKPVANKSPARWAYERLLMYISNFEKQLEPDQEVAMGLTGSDAGVVRIGGLGYFDPDVITFYGTTENGARTQLVQHVTQMNVMLMAMPTASESETPSRIGFRLQQALDAEDSRDVKLTDKA